MQLLKDFKKKERNIAYLCFEISDIYYEHKRQENLKGNYLCIDYHGWSNTINKLEKFNASENVIVECNLEYPYYDCYYNIVNVLANMWSTMYNNNQMVQDFHIHAMIDVLTMELDAIEREVIEEYIKAEDKCEYYMRILLSDECKI